MKRLNEKLVVVAFSMLLNAEGIAQVPNLKGGPLGIERVARRAAPVYVSKPADRSDEIRWLQVDLGKQQIVTAIKLYPAIGEDWGRLFRVGFPVRFRLEAANEPTFTKPLLITDLTSEDVSSEIPTKVETFRTATPVRGRYVRLTASKLDQNGKVYALALYRLEIMSGEKNVAVNQPVSDAGGPLPNRLLTRGPRPMGDGVVTDNPENVTAPGQWKAVAYKGRVPREGVVLEDGLFKTAFDQNIGYLLHSYSVDDMLQQFRDRAGEVRSFGPLRKPHPEWNTLLPGSVAGRFLMGSGNTLRWRIDTALLTRQNQLVTGIKALQRTDGYLMAYPERDILDFENGAYCRSWVTQGLIEAGLTGNVDALPMLRRFYDWFNRSPYLPELMRRGGQGRQGTIANTRLYFTSVGRPEDLQVVQRYYQENFWLDQLARRDTSAISGYGYDKPHSYLLTTLEGYLDLYRATGEQRYRDAAFGGWDLYHDHYIHRGGSLAICENEHFPADSYYLTSHTGELCGSVFWVFFNQRFHLLQPDEEKYVREIERSVYNVALANQQDDKIIYHARMLGKKETAYNENTCCEGQGTRLFGALPELIYTLADDGIYINLFSASTIRWQQNGLPFQLQTVTDFPYQPNVSLRLTVPRPTRSTVRVRVPAWATGAMAVRVNGQVTAEGKPGSYVSLNRVWSGNDVVDFTLPIGFTLTRYVGTDATYQGKPAYALEYGPLLMAVVGGSETEVTTPLSVSPQTIVPQLQPVPGKPLHFAIAGDTVHTVKPYWLVGPEPFTTYPLLTENPAK